MAICLQAKVCTQVARKRLHTPHVASLIFVEPLWDASVMEGVSVVAAVQDILLTPPVHHLARQCQHLPVTSAHHAACRV